MSPAYAGGGLAVEEERSVPAPLALQRPVHLFTVHGHVLRRLDSEANLVAPDLDHHDGDRVPEHDFLVLLAGQHEHKSSFLVLGP